MSKKVLVAGGAGFIGSHLCDLLVSKGEEVHVVDCLVTGQKKNIEHLLSKGMKFIEEDIRTFKPTEKYDEIYNLASPASPIDFSKIPVFILQTASQGHENLLKIAQAQKARILFASTSEVYGDPLEHPQKEDYWGNVNPIGPRGCYDEAKRYGEALTMAYYRAHKVNTCMARIFNTYGPRMRPDDGRVIPNFFIQSLRGESLTLYGDGSQTRSFCYVSDLAAGLYAIMKSQEHMPINLGNPVEKSVQEIADEVNQITGNKKEHTHVPLPVDDPRRRWPEISRAKKVLKWEPKISLEQGLLHCYEYFKQF